VTTGPDDPEMRSNPAGPPPPADGHAAGLVIDGDRLTCAQIRQVAAGRVALSVAATARGRAQASAAMAQQVQAERPLYGRGTGVGANAQVPVEGSEQDAAGLLLSHATSAGPPRAPGRVRAMIVVRLNQLAAGGSGADPALLDQLAELAMQADLPAVREFVGIGDGDLAALAAVGLSVADRRGRPLTMDDVLPLMSSNAAVLADAAIAAGELGECVRASVVAAALSFVALRGNPEAFSPAVEQVSPFPGAIQVCRWLRVLTGGCDPPARLQDPFHLRTLPQSLGPALDAVTRLEQVVELMANAPSENPVVLPGSVAHHGGFHAAYLAGALDSANLAVAQSAPSSARRLGALLDPARTGLPAFLSDGRPGANGAMLVEYVAVQALAELRAAAAPVSLQTASVALGIEDDATFAPLAAGQSGRLAGAYRRVLACEALAAHRALRLRVAEVPPNLASAMSALAHLDPDLRDRDLSADLEGVEAALAALAGLLAR